MQRPLLPAAIGRTPTSAISRGVESARARVPLVAAVPYQDAVAT